MDKAKLVRCQRHGTFYNPLKFDGCVTCRSVTESQVDNGKQGLSPLTVAAVLTVVLGGFFLFGKVTRAMADRGAQVAATGADLRLDPDPFRTTLEEIEQLLFADSPQPTSQGAALFQVSSKLSEEIREHLGESGNMLLRARAQQYGTEVLAFGRRQAATEDVGYAAFDTKRAQEDWQTVREAVFRDAVWFQAGAGTRRDGPAMSPMVVRMLNDLATGVENASRFGRQQAMSIGVIEGDPRSAEMRRVQRSWDSFRNSLNTRLAAAVAGLPNERVLLSRNGQRAHSLLESAVRELSSLTRYSTVPPMDARRNAFDAADRSIAESKRLLAGL